LVEKSKQQSISIAIISKYFKAMTDLAGSYDWRLTESAIPRRWLGGDRFLHVNVSSAR